MKPSFLFRLTMDSQPNFKIQLTETLSLTEMDGRLVIFSKQTGDFFGLNESAGFFLKLLLENDFEKSLSLATKEFEVPEKVLRQDFLELIDELANKKLIKKIPL
ncbi:MAG: PqqD family protein [Proteobacteria bacterium]|nr:PqqD family protein [Pseudomonadota bacterium]